MTLPAQSQGTFEADFADALSILNDNDVVPYVKNPALGNRTVQPIEYRDIQIRKSRQLKGIVKKGKIKEKQEMKK